MLEEVWVPIDPPFERYEISNYGQVCNVETGAELSPWPDPKGLLTVRLYLSGGYVNCYVHKLVARAFFLNYKSGVEVKHINGIFSDNSVLNLTLGDRARRRNTDGNNVEAGKAGGDD